GPPSSCSRAIFNEWVPVRPRPAPTTLTVMPVVRRRPTPGWFCGPLGALWGPNGPENGGLSGGDAVLVDAAEVLPGLGDGAGPEGFGVEQRGEERPERLVP